VDTEVNSTTSPRYKLAKFNPDGSAVSTFSLAPEGGKAPSAVSGIAFQLRGSPLYAYRDDDAFKLLKLSTATVTVGDRYPIFDLPKAGPATLRNQGDVLYEAVVSLDPNSTEKTGGSLTFAQSEEDKTPRALFQIPDPFFPTTRMAFAPNGDLYLAGPIRGGGLSIKRLKADKTLDDVSIALSAVPDGLWVGPDGDLYLAQDGLATPAIVKRYGADGQLKGQSEVKPKDGGFVANVRGLAFDSQGRILMAVAGFDSAGRSLKTVLSF
jgi:hypothetical protein